MRLVRRNSILLVYVKIDTMRFPIVVPLPLVMVEELLRAVLAIAWLFTGGMRGVQAHHLQSAKWTVVYGRMLETGTWGKAAGKVPMPLRAMFSGALQVEPWRYVAVAYRMVKNFRMLGPFDLVDVHTPDARVCVKVM